MLPAGPAPTTSTSKRLELTPPSRALTAYGEISASEGGVMEIPEPDHPNRFAQHLFTPLPGRYDRLAEVLSMGQNGRGGGP